MAVLLHVAIGEPIFCLRKAMEYVGYVMTYIWFSHLVAVFPVLFLSSWSVRCWSLEESAMVGNWKRQFPGHLKPHHMTRELWSSPP